MAFAGVHYLRLEIENYLRRLPASQQTLQNAYKQIESSEEIAKRAFGGSGRGLIREMEDALRGLRKALESHVSKQTIDINLEKEIHIFTEAMKKLEEEYADKLYIPLPQGDEEEDDEEEEVVSPSKMVGLCDQYKDLKVSLTNSWANQLWVFLLIGMPGIGKTTLAREIFQDPHIVKRFHRRVWVKIGRKCPTKQVPRRILAEVMNTDSDHDHDHDQICVEKDEDIALWLNASLRGKRYLVILDDVWDKYMVDYLRTPAGKGIKNYLPDTKNGSRILLTSRLQQVDKNNIIIPGALNMRLMNKEESWHLLREKVFGQESSCPSQLGRFGKKIAKKCEGLPLTILALASLLSKEERTAEYWEAVATRKNHPLFKAAYDQISKVLLPSFNRLPPLLHKCFMYIGVFPQNYEIALSKIINMWNVDGFLELRPYEDSDFVMVQCLKELASNSMLMIITKNTAKDIKTCRLHSSLLHLSNKEATRRKFCYVLNSLDDVSGEGIKGQPRLSFHTNILFGIKNVNKSVEDNCASTARSLLCYGPYLQYQVPVCYGLILLRELDILTIRFYEFPVEVLQLIQLRYLALTLNGRLPGAISELSNLEFLIVDQHLRIKSCKDSSYLPVEIWNMKELQHLQVAGSDLPDPCGNASLRRLSTLSSVSPSSCTDEVFSAIPNLNKLGIKVELSPDNGGEPLSFLWHASRHWPLTSLKCVVVNPKVTPFPPFAKLSTLPSRLTKLTLSGLGFAWQEMSSIGSLSFLEVLKLRNYAFRGPRWRVRKAEFPKLRSLVIEDTDLQRWKIGSGSLSLLECLVIKRCYKLKEIDGGFGLRLREIEMVDCNPVGAARMKIAASGTWAEVRVSCSWYDEKHKARPENSMVPPTPPLIWGWPPHASYVAHPHMSRGYITASEHIFGRFG